MNGEAGQWFAVRCVFATGYPAAAVGHTYEERITLWRAATAEEAIERAEAEAEEYANVLDDSPDTFLGLSQSYLLDDEPGDGAEIFSLMRTSTLDPDDYLTRFFNTGDERQHDIDDDDT